MPKQKYKQKPMFWNCIQYDGTNSAELVAWCPRLVYDDVKGELLLDGLVPVDPTSWVMEDNAGRFSVMIDSYFIEFFDLTAAGKPA